MGQHSGVIAALKCVASAYERGDVTADVIDSLQQLLPFSRYVRCEPGVVGGLFVVEASCCRDGSCA